MAQCVGCASPNGFLRVGDNEAQAPMCIGCWERIELVQLRRAEFYAYQAWEAEEQVNDHFEGFGIPARRRPPPPRAPFGRAPATVNNISVTGSNVGAINTGSLQSPMSQIAVVRACGNETVASAANEFLEAALGSEQLSELVKQEVAEQLTTILQEPALPAETKKSSHGSGAYEATWRVACGRL